MKIKTQNFTFLNLVRDLVADFPELSNEVRVSIGEGEPAHMRVETAEALDRVIAAVEVWLHDHGRYMRTYSGVKTLNGMGRTLAMLNRRRNAMPTTCQ